MKAWERWAFLLSFIILLISGLVFVWAKYFALPDSELSAYNHPWQPLMLKVHVIFSPVFLVLLGWVLRAHALPKWQAGSSLHWRSGLWNLSLLLLLSASGYALQALSKREVLELCAYLHIGLGVLAGLALIIHMRSRFFFRQKT